MPDASFRMSLRIDDETYTAVHYCRELLLYNFGSQEKKFGEFTCLAGCISMETDDYDLHRSEEDMIPFILRFYPDFEYEIESSYSIVIPQQGLSAHAAHAILGILRDGLNDKTKFLLYLVHRLSYEDVVPYKKNRWRHSFNGPASWAKSWISMETLYRVCQNYMDEFDFPPKNVDFNNTKIAGLIFRPFFLRPRVIRRVSQEAVRCYHCSKEVFDVIFSNKFMDRAEPREWSALKAIVNSVEKPWEGDILDTRSQLCTKDQFSGEEHKPNIHRSGINVNGLFYPKTPILAIGQMLNQGGYKE